MTSDDNDSYAWPAKHHDLRARADDYWSFSDLGRLDRFGVQSRIMGFRRAAEILYDVMLAEQSIADLDTVIFPYAACWRHHIELQLKSLLASLRALSDLPPQSRHHHWIDQLWNETRSLIITTFPEEKKTLVTANRIVNQLAELDPNGQAFRYATKRDGSRSLGAVDRINLVAFHEAIVGVANFLDATDTAIGEYLSTKQEMDAYHAAEFGVDRSDFN